MSTYSQSMAQAVRNVVKMAQTEYMDRNKGYIDVGMYLELQMRPAMAAETLKAYHNWYRRTYKPTEDLTSHFRKETPIYVCGVLTEFAQFVESIVRTATVLDKAIKVLDIYGWCQGRPGNETGGYCLLGAINRALVNSPFSRVQQDQVWSSARTAIHGLVNTSFLATWNDTPGRTVDEVKHLIRETAASVRMVPE